MEAISHKVRKNKKDKEMSDQEHDDNVTDESENEERKVLMHIARSMKTLDYDEKEKKWKTYKTGEATQ